MANEFLDKNGLSHLWSKITSIFAKKSEVEPFYIDCTLAQNGNTFSATATSDTPTQDEVDTAFAAKRPIYLRWEAAGIQLTLFARMPYGGTTYTYVFVTITGNVISTMNFVGGGFYNSYVELQEKIAVVSSEADVEDGKITIVV